MILDRLSDTPGKEINGCLIFERIRVYEKRCFPWIRSIEDRDLIAIIGAHQQESARGISCKQLYLAGIAPVATIQRRLARLIKLGIIHKRRSDSDARVFYIALSASAQKSFVAYAVFLQSAYLDLCNASMFEQSAFLRRSSRGYLRGDKSELAFQP